MQTSQDEFNQLTLHFQNHTCILNVISCTLTDCI